MGYFEIFESDGIQQGNKAFGYLKYVGKHKKRGWFFTYPRENKLGFEKSEIEGIVESLKCEERVDYQTPPYIASYEGARKTLRRYLKSKLRGGIVMDNIKKVREAKWLGSLRYGHLFGACDIGKAILENGETVYITWGLWKYPIGKELERLYEGKVLMPTTGEDKSPCYEYIIPWGIVEDIKESKFLFCIFKKPLA